MNRAFIGSLFSAAGLCSGWVSAEEAMQTASGPDFDAGAEFRFRYEFRDSWMDKGKTSVSPSCEDDCRMRTRVWGKADYEDYFQHDVAGSDAEVASWQRFELSGKVLSRAPALFSRISHRTETRSEHRAG